MDEGQILAALPICRREARRWRHVPIDQEELEAEARLGLIKGARRFDKTRGTPFSAFVLPHIRGAILDVIRAHARRESLGDGAFVEVVSVDNPHPDYDDVSFEIPDPRSLEDKIEAREIMRILAGIPWDERLAILRTQIDGVPANEVAEELGVSRDRVYVLTSWGTQRLRRRLEKWAA